LAAGARVLVSGDRSGALRARVADLLRSRYGARDVLLTDSGTSALRLAIEGAVAGSGRPVALPGYGCYDLASAAEGAGARVALYDLDPSTLGPAAGAIEALARSRPAAVVVAHLFGYPVDLRAVREAAGDAMLIEDAAQGAGGTLDGALLGSFGSVSVLSFGRGKGMTGGGGGALLAHDEQGSAVVAWTRERIGPQPASRGARPMAALAAQWLLGRPALYGIPASLPFLHLGETRYLPPRPPRPAPTSCLAALERGIEASDREVEARRRNAERLLDAARPSEHVRTVRPVAGAGPGYLRLPLLVDAEGERSRLSADGRLLGITPMYPMTLAELPSLAPFLLERRAALPGCAALARSLVSLPTHGLLRERDLRALEAAVGAERGSARQPRSVRSR
jgi:perosamine synthetase